MNVLSGMLSIITRWKKCSNTVPARSCGNIIFRNNATLSMNNGTKGTAIGMQLTAPATNRPRMATVIFTAINAAAVAEEKIC